MQHDYRERKASRIQSALALKLELSEQEVARLTAQNASLEKELKELKRLERSDERKASIRLQVQAATRVKRPC